MEITVPFMERPGVEDFVHDSNDQFTFDVDMVEDGRIDISILDGAVFDQAGNTNDLSEVYTVSYNGIPPNAPQNLIASADDQQITLTWDHNLEEDLDQYFIYGGNERAIQLNGNNQYVNMDGSAEHLSPLVFQESITISSWVKVPTETSPNGYNCLIGGWRDYGYMVYAGGSHYDGNVLFQIGGSGSDDIFTSSLRSTSDLRDGKWHYITATYNGITGNVYVDGILETSVNADPIVNTNSNQNLLRLGWPNHTGESEAFYGSIGRTEIWR